VWRSIRLSQIENVSFIGDFVDDCTSLSRRTSCQHKVLVWPDLKLLNAACQPAATVHMPREAPDADINGRPPTCYLIKGFGPSSRKPWIMDMQRKMGTSDDRSPWKGPRRRVGYLRNLVNEYPLWKPTHTSWPLYVSPCAPENRPRHNSQPEGPCCQGRDVV
jgi:hypothetical protein